MATTVMMMMMTIVPSPSLISLHSTPITQLPLSPLHFTPFPKLPGQPWDLMTSMRLPWSAASLSSVPLVSSPRLSARCSIIARLSRLSRARPSRSPSRPSLLATFPSFIFFQGCSLLRTPTSERQPQPLDLFGAKGRRNNISETGMHRPPTKTLSSGRIVTLSSQETGHPSSQSIDQRAASSILLTTIDSRRISLL